MKRERRIENRKWVMVNGSWIFQENARALDAGGFGRQAEGGEDGFGATGGAFTGSEAHENAGRDGRFTNRPYKGKRLYQRTEVVGLAAALGGKGGRGKEGGDAVWKFSCLFGGQWIEKGNLVFGGEDLGLEGGGMLVDGLDGEEGEAGRGGGLDGLNQMTTEVI
jgi:hypothetical protein